MSNMKRVFRRVSHRFSKAKACIFLLGFLVVLTSLLLLVYQPTLILTGKASGKTVTITLEDSRPFNISIETNTNAWMEEKPEVLTAQKEHVILIYTKMWGKKVWAFFEDIEKYTDRHGNHCPVQNCAISYEKNMLGKASAVVFHGNGYDAINQLELKLLSRSRRPNQVWVYFTHSPPKANKPHASFFNGIFNWTMTYQQNSDIIVPYSWELGTWQKRSELDKPLAVVDYLEDKDSVLYTVINRCGLLRDKFIKELQKYVSIDVYGFCSKYFHKNAKVMPRNSKEQLKLRKRYKFYLSAEVDYCFDFVSQRFYKVLFDGYSVPIVLGGANYSRVVPLMSYVDAMKFSTVKELGHYISFMDKNDYEYRKYQNWRQDYILGPPLSWTCEICKKLNDKTISPKVYNNLGVWYGENNCGGGFIALREVLKKSNVSV